MRRELFKDWAPDAAITMAPLIIMPTAIKQTELFSPPKPDGAKNITLIGNAAMTERVTALE